MEIEQFEKGPYRVISHDHPSCSPYPRPRSIRVGDLGDCLCECDGSQKAVVRCRADISRQPLELSAEVRMQAEAGLSSAGFADMFEGEMGQQILVRKVCAELGLVDLNAPIFRARLKQIELALELLVRIVGETPEPTINETWEADKKALILGIESFAHVSQEFAESYTVRGYMVELHRTPEFLSASLQAMIQKCESPQVLGRRIELVGALRQGLQAASEYYRKALY